MNAFTIINMLLALVYQILPLIEQLKHIAATEQLTAAEMAIIDAQLRTTRDRLARLVGEDVVIAMVPVKNTAEVGKDG